MYTLKLSCMFFYGPGLLQLSLVCVGSYKITAQ